MARCIACSQAVFSCIRLACQSAALNGVCCDRIPLAISVCRSQLSLLGWCRQAARRKQRWLQQWWQTVMQSLSPPSLSLSLMRRCKLRPRSVRPAALHLDNLCHTCTLLAWPTVELWSHATVRRLWLASAASISVGDFSGLNAMKDPTSESDLEDDDEAEEEVPACKRVKTSSTGRKPSIEAPTKSYLCACSQFTSCSGSEMQQSIANAKGHHAASCYPL